MSSDDEDLKLAIALSIEEAGKLRYQSKKPSQNEPIVISSDEEDQSINARPQQSHTKDEIPAPEMTESRTNDTSSANTFLSQRAQLEAERLARSRARQRMQEEAKHGGPSTSVRVEGAAKRDREHRDADTDEQKVSWVPVKKAKFSDSGSSQPNNAASGSAKLRESESGPLFWDGELRQTANAHVEPGKDTRPVFRLHDILGEKSDLSFAVLSSYVTQVHWIYSLMPQDIPMILVGQPDATGASNVHNILPHWVKVTPFLRNGRGCMHIKLFLLFYKSGRLRIVIPTANLVDYDWRDIENSVWLQDVPLRQEPLASEPKADDFPAQLERVLQSLHVAQGLKAILLEHSRVPLSAIADLRVKWDFSKVRAQLIPSIAGKYEGWPAVRRVGHARLMQAICQIGARADAELQKGSNASKKRKLYLECQTSSIGSYTPPWIDEFYSSACGASAQRWLDEDKTKRSKRLDALTQKDGWKSYKQIKILFPSLDTVRKSRLGENGAGTMFCRRNQWMAPRFPRPLFHDSNSKRGAVLMHTKMVLGTFEEVSSPTKLTSGKVHSATASRHNEHSSSEDDATEVKPAEREDNSDFDTSLAGWLYVGSHNFTPSAWGTVSGTSLMPVMNIVNYELGVVIPLKDPKTVTEYTSWIRPPRKYDTKDEPWIQGRD